MWRRASLPAVEGGILPPGKRVRTQGRLWIDNAQPFSKSFPPGWKPRLYVGQDGQRYCFQTGSKRKSIW
jgi:hypothetical protein